MFVQISSLVLCLLEIVDSCIPTQQVETDVPGPASPCVTCQKVYDTSCVGYLAGTAWCATSTEASVSYSIGGSYIEETVHYYDDAACLLSFTCPAGTTVQVDVLSGSAPSDPYNYYTGYCVESGAGAGQWYYGQWLLTEFNPIAMSSFRCVG